MQQDFPEIIKVSSLGQSWEKRSIDLITIDAKDYLSKNKKTSPEPAISEVLQTKTRHSLSQ